MAETTLYAIYTCPSKNMVFVTHLKDYHNAKELYYCTEYDDIRSDQWLLQMDPKLFHKLIFHKEYLFPTKELAVSQRTWSNDAGYTMIQDYGGSSNILTVVMIALGMDKKTKLRFGALHCQDNLKEVETAMKKTVKFFSGEM
jgi:hypothetical protein